MATSNNYHPSKETIMSMQRELLKQAEPMVLFKEFGKDSQPKESFLDKILYFFRLKKREPAVSHFPEIKKGDTIKFRRPKSFKAKNDDFDDRFVSFGYILIQALEKISKNKQGADASFAKRELDRFMSMVNKEGEHYRHIKMKQGE